MEQQFDENGNPILTPEEVENLEWEQDYGNVEFEQRMDGYVKRKAREQIKFNQQIGQKRSNDLFVEALKEEGLDLKQFQELAQTDPQTTEGIMKESFKMVAKNVARRKGRPQPKRDAQTGQYITREPAGQPQPNERVNAAKEVINKRALSESEELDILGAVLGDIDLLK